MMLFGLCTLIALAVIGVAWATDPQAAVRVAEVDDYRGQGSYRIVTPRATWFYHKAGAGFAGLIDPDGNDWISFHPTGGSDGAYRGIPNLAHPEGYFHPGGADCESRIVHAGPDAVTIESTAEAGAWTVRWEIGPLAARLTVLAAPKPYWCLYEGTPGGRLDEENDVCVRAPGVRASAAHAWDEPLPRPKWVVFADPKGGRALYMVHHDGGEEIDSFRPMEGNMTVFGFGRRQLAKLLTAVPARFTVGLTGADPTEYAAAVSAAIDSAAGR